jgi:phosphatidylinositol glycan class H protein
MLTTTRPTPTTVSYTVSTRSQRGTLTSRLTTITLLTLRLTAVLLILYALLLEFQILSTGTAYALPAWLSTRFLPSGVRHHPALGQEPKTGPAEPPSSSTLPFPPLARASAYALILWLAFRKGYTSESLLVIRGLGVQTATAGTSFLWGGSTRFIAASAVQDIFIHEAFRGFEVRFYLCIVVEGEEGVVVVFPVSFFGPLSFNYVERLLAGWEMDLWDCFANRITFFCRARCLEERFSKRCGGERGLACTSRRHDNVVLKVFVQVIYRHV